MDVNQLSNMLPGSGTALITFDATLNVHVQYEITVKGTTKTGENACLGKETWEQSKSLTTRANCCTSDTTSNQ